MNRVFLVLVTVAVTVAFGRDVGVLDEFAPALAENVDHPAPHLSFLTQKTLDSAKVAIEIALGLIGILMLWMGILRVAEAAGLVQALARLLRPILTRLFPDVPADHPAMGAMVMNVAANMLGLGNAATPLGLEAMRHLQSLNVHKRNASNAMCLFLAINTSGLTLIPTRAIAMRAAEGSTDATAIVLPTLLATLCSTIVAVIVVKLLQPRFAFVPDEIDATASPLPPVANDDDDTSEAT